MPNMTGRAGGLLEWKLLEEVPRRTSLVPLAFLCFVHCLIGVETKGLLDYQGWAGIIFHCTEFRSLSKSARRRGWSCIVNDLQVLVSLQAPGCHNGPQISENLFRSSGN